MPTCTSFVTCGIHSSTLNMIDACECSNPSYARRVSECASKCSTPKLGDFTATATSAPNGTEWSPPTMPTSFPRPSKRNVSRFTQEFTTPESAFTRVSARASSGSFPAPPASMIFAASALPSSFATTTSLGSSPMKMPASYGFSTSRS